MLHDFNNSFDARSVLLLLQPPSRGVDVCQAFKNTRGTSSVCCFSNTIRTAQQMVARKAHSKSLCVRFKGNGATPAKKVPPHTKEKSFWLLNYDYSNARYLDPNYAFQTLNLIAVALTPHKEAYSMTHVAESHVLFMHYLLVFADATTAT